MVELLGPMPHSMTQKGRHASKFFNSKGEFKHIKNLKFWPLEAVLREKYEFSKEDAEEFASFLLPMLAFIPSQRVTAEKALQHPFLQRKQEDKK